MRSCILPELNRLEWKNSEKYFKKSLPPKKKSATSSGKKSFLASVPVRPILDDVLDGSHGRALKLFNDDNGRNVAASVRDVHDVVWTLVR